MRTHQYFLKGVDALVGDRHAVDLADLVADVQRRLPVDHAAVHDARHDAPAVLRHFQRDALRRVQGINITSCESNGRSKLDPR